MTSETVRVTLVLPKRLWEEVKQMTPSGRRSRLVAKALEAEMQHQRRIQQLEELSAFQNYLREKYGETPDSVDDIRQMREERDADITGFATIIPSFIGWASYNRSHCWR